MSSDRRLSLAKWDDLPLDDSRRCELVRGVTLVVPRPTALHQRAMLRLATELDRQLPDQLTALPDVEVVIGATYPATVRAPDVVVVPSEVAAANRARFDGRDVLLAVEVVSPGTDRTDRITKAAEYADAGIGAYWVVDLTAPDASRAFLLVDGEYEEVDRRSPAAVRIP
jgi:Uma2 family endonuclease